MKKPKVIKSKHNTYKKKEIGKGAIYTTLAIGLLALILFFLISDIMAVGERLRSIHVVVEIAFYALVVGLFYFFLAKPTFIILFAPSFPIGKVFDENTKEFDRTLKKIAKNLIKNDITTEAQTQRLLDIFESEGDLKEELADIYSNTIKKDVNNLIIESSRNVMFMTALSQNSSVDMLSVIINSMNMIKKIVVRCGFRPSFPKLAKLYVNVFATCLIADGIEKIGLETVFNNLKGLKGGFLLSNMSEGLTNGFLMLRLGMVARNYIFTEGKPIIRETIRKSAILEAAKILPGFISDVVTIIPKTILNFFKKDSYKEKEEETDKK